MSDSLFGEQDPFEPLPAPTAGRTTDSLADWQVTQLRQALDAQGLDSMADRQRVVEELVGRPVASLRELTYAEARALAESLASRRGRPGSGAQRSAWEDRDGDTWIDRL